MGTTSPVPGRLRVVSAQASTDAARAETRALQQAVIVADLREDLAVQRIVVQAARTPQSMEVPADA